MRALKKDSLDCYRHLTLVIETINELFELYPKSKSRYWKRFMKKIPNNYKELFENDEGHHILYFLCTNMFFVIDLFEKYDFKKGINLTNSIDVEFC